MPNKTEPRKGELPAFRTTSRARATPKPPVFTPAPPRSRRPEHLATALLAVLVVAALAWGAVLLWGAP